MFVYSGVLSLSIQTAGTTFELPQRRKVTRSLMQTLLSSLNTHGLREYQDVFTMVNYTNIEISCLAG